MGNRRSTLAPRVRWGPLIGFVGPDDPLHQFVADNVFWHGSVLLPRSAGARAVARFNRVVRDDPRVECVMLTVRDGITLARKRP